MTSLIASEALETPDRVAQQLDENDHTTDKLGSHLKLVSPRFIYIVGRGSSDHAGAYAKYLFETATGIPVVNAAPSVTSIYQKKINLHKALVLIISQSGKGKDIIEQAQMAQNAGAYVVALVNEENSPLCNVADVVLPLKAGKQNAPFATKTVLTTLCALLQLTAKWTNDKALKKAVIDLPSILQQAVEAPSMLSPSDFVGISNCAVLGRGFGYSVAKEIAIKLVGVCGIHAEPYSSAEFLHGGVSLLEHDLSIFNAVIKDESYQSHMDQIKKFEEQGVQLHHLHQPLSKIPPRVGPLALLQRFYLDLSDIAQARGIDPNNPPGLHKITRNV